MHQPNPNLGSCPQDLPGQTWNEAWWQEHHWTIKGVMVWHHQYVGSFSSKPKISSRTKARTQKIPHTSTFAVFVSQNMLRAPKIVIFGVLVYLWLYNAPSRVSFLGSSLVRLLYPAEDEKVPPVLYPPLQSPCVLCDQGLPYRSHFNKDPLVHPYRMPISMIEVRDTNCIRLEKS